MRVTLIRHAEAGDDAPRDEARALTSRGRADARRLGRVLARRGVRFSTIVTSPLVRAVQTAEIVAAETEYRGRMTATDLLVPKAEALRIRLPEGPKTAGSLRWRVDGTAGTRERLR